MKYNNELRIIDTQEKAYLLGFLYGDGTISTYMSDNKRRYETKISIQIDDELLINNLHKIFPFFYIGTYDFSKHNANSKKQISIANSSKKLYDDLILNGLYPRKSYENACNLKIPNIDPKLISHFIRGFFDADGSIYTLKKRQNLRKIEFCSVSKEFINELDIYLRNLNINSWSVREKKPKGNSRQILYILTFTKTAEVLKLIDFMYNDVNISLKRKTDKCLNYKPINLIENIKNRNIICPHCGSNIVIKNGTRGKSIRYKCKSCGQGFSKRIDGSKGYKIKY
jgi:intein/homing endonuclease